jgi:hypothetical protein
LFELVLFKKAAFCLVAFGATFIVAMGAKDNHVFYPTFDCVQLDFELKLVCNV